ncbi:MAG: hypothetical protein U5K74_15040 [Gemmatimonadaceae bacterium]|nr:hypothetical protein [Gemmatimonadaceae bacterium]
MPKGTFWRVALQHVEEVDEDALRRLGPQVDDRRRVLDGPHERLEHQVELARLGQLAVVVLARLLARLLRAARILELVGAEARLARLAVDQRVGEAGHVPARLPDARMHEDRRVEPLDVIARAHHARSTSGP